MMRKILVACTAFAAITAFTLVAPPVEAGTCTVLSAKGRGIDETNASSRSVKHLTNKINHYAHKNKLGSVKVAPRSTVCSKKGGLNTCTSSTRVCG
jgi:hypothetical protein